VQGAKPAFSYDERFIAYHHYIGGGDTADADARELGFTGADDPGFAEYTTQGASNIYILDLLTGRSTRVTTMGAGQYALYPFFRNDGWIYFIVRTLGTTREHVVASDAALLQ
jgi:Tol biopolymer transport system component